VGFPYLLVFLGLLLAYAVYSLWSHLDPRLPLVAAVVLLVAAGVCDVAGDIGAANELAEFVFVLLASGLLLLLLERARRPASRAAPGSSGAGDAEAPDPPQERERATEQSLDGAEQEPVAFVDTAGQQDDQDEQAGDAETDRGQAP
jgi:hypothetical protein